jgi:predicted dehydrogenase
VNENGPSQQVGLAVIGLGRIGEVHARNISRHVSEADLVAIADADETRAQALGSELGCSARSVDEVLSDQSIEGVVIATPVDTHLDLVRDAARADKHILCEKPLSFDAEAAAALVDELNGSGLVFQMGFQRRFDPDYAEAQRRLSTGDLGQPYLFRTSMRDMAPPAEEIVRAQAGGFVVDATGHDFDAARWLVDEVAEVTAFGAALSSPLFKEIGDCDNLVVVMRFVNGALGVIDESRVSGYGFECSTELMGSRGTVRVGDHHRHQLSLLTQGREEYDRVTDFLERFELAYRLELSEFAKAVRSRALPRAGGIDGVAALVLSQAAAQSLESGQTVSLAEHPWYQRLLERV